MARQKKSGCFCFFSRPTKISQNSRQNQQNSNNLTTTQNPNQQQQEQQNKIEQGPQIKITTNVDVENIKCVETKPNGLFSEIYPYSCPICLKYLNLIMKHSCCGNYVCLSCLNLIEEQIKTKKLENQCWWCRVSDFEILDENLDNKDIKVYSDQNDLDKTNKDFKKIINNSKNFKIYNKENLEVRSVDEFIQTIKSVNFYKPNNKNTHQNLNNENENEDDNENSRDDFNQEYQNNQKFSKTAGEVKIKKIQSSNDANQRIINRNFRTDQKKTSNLYLVDPQTGQYNNNNIIISQNNPIQIKHNQSEIHHIKRSSFYNENHNNVQVQQLNQNQDLDDLQQQSNLNKSLENQEQIQQNLSPIQQDQLENQQYSNESQVKSEEKINSTQKQIQDQGQSGNQDQIKVDEGYENTQLYEMQNND